MGIVTLTGIHSIEPQADGSTIITYKTKHVGDYSLLLTRECMSDLLSKLPYLADLNSKSAVNGAKQEITNSAGIASAVRDSNSTDRNSSSDTSNASDDDNITIHVPKRWAVAPETKRHDVVLLMFDPQTPAQQGFALSPEAANQVASALSKNATIVLEKAPPKAASK